MSLKDEIMDKLESEVRVLLGGASSRTRNVVLRGYLYGWVNKPLKELSDEELLALRSVGIKTLVEIRKVISQPPVEYGVVKLRLTLRQARCLYDVIARGCPSGYQQDGSLYDPWKEVKDMVEEAIRNHKGGGMKT